MVTEVDCRGVLLSHLLAYFTKREYFSAPELAGPMGGEQPAWLNMLPCDLSCLCPAS